MACLISDWTDDGTAESAAQAAEHYYGWQQSLRHYWNVSHPRGSDYRRLLWLTERLYHRYRHWLSVYRERMGIDPDNGA